MYVSSSFSSPYFLLPELGFPRETEQKNIKGDLLRGIGSRNYRCRKSHELPFLETQESPWCNSVQVLRPENYGSLNPRQGPEKKRRPLSNTPYLEKLFLPVQKQLVVWCSLDLQNTDWVNNGLVPLAPYWPVLMDFPFPLSYATEVTATPQNCDTVTSLFCFLWGEWVNIEFVLIVQCLFWNKGQYFHARWEGTFTYLCG